MLSALMLAGCMSEEEAAARATAEAKRHCESEGKQFVLRDKKAVDRDNIFGGAMVVAGYCLGPGDPGYVAKP